MSKCSECSMWGKKFNRSRDKAYHGFLESKIPPLIPNRSEETVISTITTAKNRCKKEGSYH
jgi:hypothetical protein